MASYAQMDTLRIVKDETVTWFMFLAGSDSRAPGYLSVCSPCRPKPSPHPYQSFQGLACSKIPLSLKIGLSTASTGQHILPQELTCCRQLQGAGQGAVSRVSAYTASLNSCLGNFGVLILYLCLLDLRQAQTSPAAKKQADLPKEYQPVQFILLSFFPPMRCLAAHVSVGNPMRLRQMPCSRNTLALSFTWTHHLLTQESSGRTQHCFSPHFPYCRNAESI